MKFFKFVSYRSRILSICIITIITNFILFNIVSYYSIIGTFQSDNNKNMESTLDNYKIFIERFFGEYERTLNFMSYDTKMKRVSENPEKYEEEVEKMFRDFQNSHNEINLISYGTEKGQYFFDKDRNSVPEGYDPRVRPFYKIARTISKDAVDHTEVYKDIYSGKNITTIVKQIYNEKNEFVGVLGIGINMGYLAERNSINIIGDNGYTFITCGNKYFVHNNTELINTELKDPRFLEIALNKISTNFEFKDGDKKLVVSARYDSSADMTFWAVGYKSELLRPYWISFRNSMVITMLLMIFIIFIVIKVIRRYETKLINSEKKYRTLFNSMEESFCIIELIFNEHGKPVDYRFIEVNQAFEKQTGLKNVEGKLVGDLATNNDDNWIEVYGKVALTGESIRAVKEIKGLNQWYSINAFKTDINDSRRVAVVFNDVTEDIKAKNKLEETLKIQEEIFANVSHELKTPLNVIFSANQLVELYIKSDSLVANKEKVAKNTTIIKQNCYRFTRLINNIVDISKIDSGFFKLKLSNQNIVEVIEDIVQSVSGYINERGINIIFDTDIEEKIIACDPEKIERIILNLISNSIKFTNAGGIILVNIFDKGDNVEIDVKDTGIGIDKKHLEDIFERFHQVDKSLSRNAEGSGIGLYLVERIVKLHGGKISVESTIGEGSLFKIELPAKIIEEQETVIDNMMTTNNKIEMINIEFSDIYSI